MEPYSDDFDEIFGELREFMKKMRMQKMNGAEDTLKDGEPQGNWDVKEIDEPNVKGYAIQGRFWTTQPNEAPSPFEPFEPEPFDRHPMPQRPFALPHAPSDKPEPLVDIFNEEKTIRVYVELPGEEKDNIKLNIAGNKIEVKANRFYKLIDLPQESIDLDRTSSKYNNGVLEIAIPKKEASPSETRKINID